MLIESKLDRENEQDKMKEREKRNFDFKRIKNQKIR